jgi:fatty-acyl-CoA synthase
VRVLTAGAPPAAATIERVENELGWPMMQVYGLSETSPFITVCECRPEHDRMDMQQRSEIKARQGVELATSGELSVFDDEGNEIPHDGETIGEIVVRGNVVMKGYFNDADATAKAMKGGWFHTGDGAVIHPDGYVEIQDRLKDVIISGGENISSIEVEGILLRHPAVQEVAVVGVAHPKWGESPHAYVVLASGAKVSADELCDYAREHMAHFKVPSGFSFIAELPKTATGKVQKYVLRGQKSAIHKQ